MSEKPAPMIDSVRDELRQAIFFSAFQAGGNAGTPQENVLRQGSCGFVEFGVRSRLIDPDEGNEWLGAIWGKKPLAEVSAKYIKKKPV